MGGPGHVLRAILCTFLALGIAPTTQVTLAHANNSRLPFNPSNPYAIVVGEVGTVFIFDGQQLHQFQPPVSSDLNSVKWRHDGQYALAVGENSTLLKIAVSNNAIDIEKIPTNLDPSHTFESITWTQDDSMAIVSGPGGNLIVYDGSTASVIHYNITQPVFASAFSPTNNLALLVGQSGLIAEHNSTITHVVDPKPTNYSFFGVGWDPTGKYALVGGDHAKLFKYQGGTLTEQNTAVLFEVAPHLIRSITFNKDGGVGLITGQLGLTVVATTATCDYSIFNNPSTVCLNYKRLQLYNDFNGTRVDLHRIGHFYSASWMPGTQTAYAVGTSLDGSYFNVRGWTVAKITTTDVTVILQDRKGVYGFRSIDWNPTVRAGGETVLMYYIILIGTAGFASVVVVTKRKTLGGWFVGHHKETGITKTARMRQTETDVVEFSEP